MTLLEGRGRGRSSEALPARIGGGPSGRGAGRGKLRPGAGPWGKAGTILPPLLFLAACIGVWELYVSARHVGADVLPSPARVLRHGWSQRQALWSNTLPTLKETAAGFGCSLVVAVVFATLIDFFTLVRRCIYPLLVASQTIPVIAIAPLLDIWFGFGLLPKIIVVALTTFFPITVAMTEGFESTEKEATNLLRSMGAGKVRIFRSVRLPSAVPYFFAGLRIAITYAVVGAIFAEYVGAFKGLGIYMQEQTNQNQTDLVFAAVIITALVSVMLFGLTYVIQRLAIPWWYLARRQATT